jgi:hypothetical protein
MLSLLRPPPGRCVSFATATPPVRYRPSQPARAAPTCHRAYRPRGGRPTLALEAARGLKREYVTRPARPGTIAPLPRRPIATDLNPKVVVRLGRPQPQSLITIQLTTQGCGCPEGDEIRETLGITARAATRLHRPNTTRLTPLSKKCGWPGDGIRTSLPSASLGCPRGGRALGDRALYALRLPQRSLDCSPPGSGTAC